MAKDKTKNTENPIQKKKKSEAIRKLLIGATLSTALVSFFSTAQGMNMYIFKGNILFSLVISGAIQGSLYALSISGKQLIKSGKLTTQGNRMVRLLWVVLLITSSTFSFVYVSKTAYSDNVLRQDAEENMNQYLQSESNKLLDYVKRLEDTTLIEIQEYINILNGGNVGFTVKATHKNVLNRQKATLQSFDNESRSIGKYFSSTMLVYYIDTISSGNYTSGELDSYKNELNDAIKKANDGKIECQNNIDANNKKILGDVNATDEQARIGYNARLAQYTNTSDPTFLSIQRTVESLENDNKENDAIIKTLEKLILDLEECQRFISEDFETGTESVVYELTKNINAETNKDEINTDEVLRLAGEIYNKLLDGNTPDDKDKISRYSGFKDSIRNYREYIDAKQSLERELDLLGQYNQYMLTGDAEMIVTGGLLEETITMEGATDHLDDMTKTTHKETTIESVTQEERWNSFWSQRLAALLREIQNLPEGEDTNCNNKIDNEEKVIDKEAIIRNVSNRKRLYLVKLNDFDRAISLLKEVFPYFGFHKHGNMVVVSLLFAFGLDLFSLGTGILLYYFIPKKHSNPGNQVVYREVSFEQDLYLDADTTE